LFELDYQINSDNPACENVVAYIGDARGEGSMETLFDPFRLNLIYHAAA
jgi:FlaA1/EpsC-like NDP-sugar epimerase